MSPSGAPPAGRPGKPSGMAPAAAAKLARCTLRSAPNAVKKPKYLLNPAKAGPSIAANVSARCGQIASSAVAKIKYRLVDE